MALVANQLLLAKIQSTVGTYQEPAAGDAVLCSNLKVGAVNARMNDRAVIKGTLGTLGKLYGGSLMQVTFDVELNGSGAVGTAPEIDAILRAASLGVTIVASTSVTYAPVSTGQEILSVVVDQDGKLIKLKDCVADITFDFQTGAARMASVTLTGRRESITDGSVTASYAGIGPVAVVNVPFSITGYSLTIEKLSISLGNTIGTPADMSDPQGYGPPEITARAVNGSLDPLQTLVATAAFDADWQSGAVKSLTTGAIGATAGNILTITCPYISSTDIQDGEREGILTHDYKFDANESAGDDEISIVFT